MIAKKGWFVRRKYSGWGFTPKSWQGWAYIAVLIAPMICVSAFQVDAHTKFIISCIWGAIMLFAFIDIMISVKKDERETLHEAFAERNALWAILTVLVGGILYDVAKGIANNTVIVDPVILIALGAGVITKAVSNFYLDRKN